MRGNCKREHYREALIKIREAYADFEDEALDLQVQRIEEKIQADDYRDKTDFLSDVLRVTQFRARPNENLKDWNPAVETFEEYMEHGALIRWHSRWPALDAQTVERWLLWKADS